MREWMFKRLFVPAGLACMFLGPVEGFLAAHFLFTTEQTGLAAIKVYFFLHRGGYVFWAMAACALIMLWSLSGSPLRGPNKVTEAVPPN
jgi:hypothetical protein